MSYSAGNYDIIVVGAGHAGCEAALAAARLGQRTLLLTINLESVAMMPCNPNIGGTGKGHLVREIDALGGEMGKNIDATMIQSKMLNTGKGPAVHSLRAQADKKAYQFRMKQIIENQPRLFLKQQEVMKLLVEEGRVKGVEVRTGAVYKAQAVIIATGTYLRGKILIGEIQYDSGPDGLYPSMALSKNLGEVGIKLRRFKTGTPARVDARSVDYSKMTIQKGDEKIIPFSFETEAIEIKQIPCYLTYTNPKTHAIIRENMHRSALAIGTVEGVGPRYCPSIETKVERFADKDRHQIFMEPEGANTTEVYVQGMSSSLPEEVQIELYRSVEGMENVEFMRPAYAIDYDCIYPTRLRASLASKDLDGLYFAGQINGTSGYEEAAAQGLIAGINAVREIKGEEPIIIGRADGYIGVLIDDIITKGTNEPYRMMTSRCEYRLLLRQDNADERLTPLGYKIGLISEERHRGFLDKQKKIQAEMERLDQVRVKPDKDTNAFLAGLSSAPIKNGLSLKELLKRPEINYDNTRALDPQRPDLKGYIVSQVEVCIKYAGYIAKQIAQVEQFKKLENKKIPEDINYGDISGLRLEAIEKLSEIRPTSMGQANRISGVNAADLSVLLVYLESRRRKKAE